MNHGLTLLVFILLLKNPGTLCHEEKTRYEKIEELVMQNMHLVEPYLNAGRDGMPQNFLHTYIQKEKHRNRKKSDFELQKKKYADQAKNMFFHAYDNYMIHAFPADELMPLSCKGRVRGLSRSRGEVDDALGRYMLTLVDTLDTLIVLNEYEKFEEAVKLVIRGLSFDTDLTVNLFEVNIRVLGGLLGGHTGCLYLQSLYRLQWYSNELLILAQELADRMLPAFDTPTGLPIPKINLRHSTFGIKDNETCTACAGTLFIEFAALTRYTGNSTYESRARAALDYLYHQRVPSSDLPGSIINVNSGKWVRKDSSVGAGIDSYYEYLIKGYMISGDEALYTMFQTQYQATRIYLKRRELMVTVHSGSPNNKVREHQDALQAFWPGVQVLAGNIKEAEEVYNHYINVSKRNQNTLPEAFLVDYRMYWPQFYIRPELLESTYILYKATGNPRYVEEAVRIMQAIEDRCKVECGFAGLKNVATGELEDRLDSFVLAETFKYLYLIFADEDDVGVPIDDYVLTTEAHIVPLHIQFYSNEKVKGSMHVCDDEGVYKWSWLESHLFKELEESRKLDPSIACVPEDQPVQFRSRKLTSALKAADFDYKNVDHTVTLMSMGIHIEVFEDDRIQLVHNGAKAHSQQLAVEGVIFIKEMQDIAKAAANQGQSQQTVVKEVFVQSIVFGKTFSLDAGSAMFGPDLVVGASVAGQASYTFPADACSVIINEIRDKIALIHRGGCMFVEKVRNAERGGATGVIILDNKEGGGEGTVVAMSGDGIDDVTIPSVIVSKVDSSKLMEWYSKDPASLIVELREPESVHSDGQCRS